MDQFRLRDLNQHIGKLLFEESFQNQERQNYTVESIAYFNWRLIIPCIRNKRLNASEAYFLMHVPWMYDVQRAFNEDYMDFSVLEVFFTCITRMLSPVSLASCSRICLKNCTFVLQPCIHKAVFSYFIPYFIHGSFITWLNDSLC